MGSGVTILALYDRISLFHTMAPWILGLHRHAGASNVALRFTDDPEWCLSRDTNEHLIIVRRFLKPSRTDLALMERLRARYRRIFFLNGNAGGGLHRPEVLPYVDRFYNKALFSDRALYSRALYGGELFTDYYHREFGILDDPEVNPAAVSDADAAKLHVHWNIGVGDFPRRRLRQRVGVALARTPAVSPRIVKPLIHTRGMLSPTALPPTDRTPRTIDINARLGAPGYPTIAFHRRHLGAALEAAVSNHGWAAVRDRVSPRQYLADLHRSKITFSPFGWGELCFRDFEAIRAGSLMVKPSMDHLDTWPDVFVPGETYVPVRWDGSDLEETMVRYLSDRRERERIAANALDRLRTQLLELPERAAGILEALIAP